MKKYRFEDREVDMRDCANRLDWKYIPKDDSGMLKWLLDFKLFRVGHSKEISPLITSKVNDLEFASAFDYKYVVSSNNSSVTYRQTVFFRYSKSIALPHFQLVPEKWYHRVGTALGMQDIDFVQYPEFSKNYLLRGMDEPYIRYHFEHPEMIRFFNNNALFSLEGVNYLMIAYMNNIVLSRNEIYSLVQLGNTMHDFFADKTPNVELPENTPEGEETT